MTTSDSLAPSQRNGPFSRGRGIDELLLGRVRSRWTAQDFQDRRVSLGRRPDQKWPPPPGGHHRGLRFGARPDGLPGCHELGDSETEVPVGIEALAAVPLHQGEREVGALSAVRRRHGAVGVEEVAHMHGHGVPAVCRCPGRRPSGGRRRHDRSRPPPSRWPGYGARPERAVARRSACAAHRGG